MTERNLSDLKANPTNPRTISKDDFAALKKSISEFGDLSGIVLNIRTGQLVGGHQRVEAFKALGGQQNIEIAQRLETPTEKGTVAIGFVLLSGERYAYREVDWDPTFELAANIAANRIQGQFDTDLLAEVTYQIQQENEALLELTGQREDEIKNLLKRSGALADDDEPSQENEDDDKLSFSVTPEQRILIAKALEHVRITRDIPSTDGSAMNGSALYYIARQYLETSPPLTPEQTGENFTPAEIPE